MRRDENGCEGMRRNEKGMRRDEKD